MRFQPCGHFLVLALASRFGNEMYGFHAQLFALPGIRLVGMGALLAQIVKGQGIGFSRTFFLIGPIFALFTVASMLVSIGSAIWVGLWCIARVH